MSKFNMKTNNFYGTIPVRPEETPKELATYRYGIYYIQMPDGIGYQAYQIMESGQWYSGKVIAYTVWYQRTLYAILVKDIPASTEMKYIRTASAGHSTIYIGPMPLIEVPSAVSTSTSKEAIAEARAQVARAERAVFQAEEADTRGEEPVAFRSALDAQIRTEIAETGIDTGRYRAVYEELDEEDQSDCREFVFYKVPLTTRIERIRAIAPETAEYCDAFLEYLQRIEEAKSALSAAHGELTRLECNSTETFNKRVLEYLQSREEMTATSAPAAAGI